MPWFGFALISALLATASTLVEKKTLIREHALPFSATLAVLTAALSLPFLVLVEWQSLTPIAILVMYGVSIIGAIGFLLLTKGLRHMEVSVASPLLVFGPAFTAIAALVVLGEALTQLQAVGILCMVIGSYILEAHRGKGFLEPIRELWRSKYVHFILWALVLYAGASLIDRTMLSRIGIHPVTYLTLIHLFLAVNFIAAMLWTGGGFPGFAAGFRVSRWWLLLVSVLTIGYRLADLFAIAMAPLGPVLTIKRLSTLLTTVIGGELFHEDGVLRKAVACMVMLAGVALVLR